eukprot:10501980-Karenia_brevis.AAC.1
MRQRKLHDYAPHMAQLRAQSIEHRPITWSTYGRPPCGHHRGPPQHVQACGAQTKPLQARR